MSQQTWPAKKSASSLAAPVVGTMNFGKRTPEPEATRIVARALERGATWFDVANAYGEGESERILGRALEGHRSEVKVATKVGIGTMKGPKEGLAPERITAALDESLTRLGVERIDLYYLHAPDSKTRIEDTLGAVERALVAGKIGAWGVSNYSSWQIVEIVGLCEARGMPPPQASQVLYNLMVRQLDVEYFAFARRYRLHTTVYNPLAGGLLAGRGLHGRIEPGSRFDSNPVYQRRYLSDRFLELARACAALAAKVGLTPAQLAYAWVTQRPGVDSVLLGPASVDHLDAGIDGCALALPAGVATMVDDLHRTYAGTDVTYTRF